jgi:hypothetical protein
MLEEHYQKDNYDLMQIENISKQISDLINSGDYSRIENLDKTRLDLIKNFKDKNNKNFQTLIRKTSDKNKNDINQIEVKLTSLKDEKSKFIKRFKAYNY